MIVRDPGPPESSASTRAVADGNASPEVGRHTQGIARFWRPVRGPAVAALVVGALHLLARTPYSVPDLFPIVLLVVVVVSAIDGIWPALISGVILVAYAAYSYSASGHLLSYTGANLTRLLMLVVVTLATAVVVGTVKTTADLLRTERQAQSRRVTETLKSKSEFMNAAAHELRTPLTVISGYLSMLGDGTFGALPDQWRDPINVIERKTRELAALVDKILLSARIESGTVPTATEQFDVRDAVRQAVERAEPRVTMERASLTYELPSAPVLVEVDRDHLAQILDNLISNALTYTDARPWVKVMVGGGSQARVVVKDRGWGVPEAMRQTIFERFVRYQEPGHRPKRGTGLGLSISRELAERFGGSLDLVWTQPGKGSTFLLRLPTVAAPKA